MKPLRFLPILALAVRALADIAPAPASSAEDHYDMALQAELLAILESDHAGRAKLHELTKGDPRANTPETAAIWKQQQADDALNLPRITAILDQRGWVGPDEVGAKASSAFFYVIQHSNTATQKKYLPLLREAVLQKKAPAGQLALMQDRVDLAEGKRQTYGSQLGSQGNGPLRVRPIEDPDHVDERRAAVGLPPMSEYLKNFNLVWDLEAFKKDMPAEERRWSGAITPDPASYDPVLRKQLLTIAEDIGATGNQYGELLKKFGPDSPEAAAFIKHMNEASAAHLPEVTALLDQRGWIDVKLVGFEGQNALLTVLQNADIAVQRKYLQVMRQAVNDNKLALITTTWMEDTVALADTGKQIYGSHVKTDATGENIVEPIADPDHVDERRAAAGLDPMGKYLQQWNLTWDLAAHKQVQEAAK